MAAGKATDLLVRREVGLVRAMRWHGVPIGHVVDIVRLLSNLNSQQGSQSGASQSIMPLLEHEVNELTVLLNK